LSRDSPPWLKKENKGELPSLANQNARRGKPPSLLCGRKNLQHNKEEFPLPCHIETVSSDEEGGTSPCRVKKKRTSTQQGLQTLLATSTESCRAEKHHIFFDASRRGGNPPCRVEKGLQREEEGETPPCHVENGWRGDAEHITPPGGRVFRVHVIVVFSMN